MTDLNKPILNRDEVQILKAVWNGQADPHTQRLAIQIIVEGLGMIDVIPLVPGEPDRTALNCGRQFVAKQIHAAISLPSDAFEEANRQGNHDRTSTDTSSRTRVSTATERASKRS